MRIVGRLRKPDAGADADFRKWRGISGECERTTRNERRSIELLRNREPDTQAPGAAHEVAIGYAGAVRAQQRKPAHRFDGTYQNRSSFAFAFARNIQAVRRPVNTIDVRVPDRQKHRCAPWRDAAKRMGRWIADFVCLGFDDAADYLALREAAYEEGTDKVARERDGPT